MSLDEKLAMLDGWNLEDVIAIDGQNGTTKSTLCEKLSREYRKINDLAPDITCGSSYNHDTLCSFEYMCFQLATITHDSVWDRCCYSNLIFYYAHYLMGKFGDTQIPKDESKIWPIFTQLAVNTQLSDTLDFCKSKNNMKALFLVCSDIKYLSTILLQRARISNGANDLWNSKEYNYQMAQYHAYVWFGKALGFPVFDLMDFVNKGISLGEMHVILAHKIDRQPTNRDVVVPMRSFATMMASLSNDVLIYDYSKK